MNHSRLRSILLSFTTGQGALQAIQMVSGFVLVRYMDVHEYGVVAFMLTVQATAGVLTDLGLRDGIVAVNGQASLDRTKLGALVTAALHQRRINLAFVSAGILAAFVSFHFLQGLPLQTTLILAASSIAFAAFNGWHQYFSVALILKQDMNAYYIPQLVFQASRLALILAFVAANFLDAVALAFANLFALAGTGIWYRSKSKKLLELTNKAQKEDVSRLRAYFVPLIPWALYYAFQDQVAIAILTVSGHTTNLAQVYALGRLAIVFQFFGSATTTLAVPWIAKAPNQKLLERYAVVAGSAFILAIVILAGALLVPNLYLWILGDHYQNLHWEMFIAIVGASASFVAGILYNLNNSRRWIWPITGLSNVIAVVSAQAYCIWAFDMTVTANVLWMNLLVGVASMLLQMAYSALGFATRNKA